MYTPTEAQKELFVIACRAGDRITRAMTTYTKELVAWLHAQYGETKPTYEQFWSDREALAILAKERGLADDQWVRKPYNAAVKSVYGELPVSPSKEAVAKRLVRGTNPRKPHAPDPARQLRTIENAMHRLIEQYSYAQVLTALSHILGEHEETQREGIRVANLSKRLAGVDGRPSVH